MAWYLGLLVWLVRLVGFGLAGWLVGWLVCWLVGLILLMAEIRQTS